MQYNHRFFRTKFKMQKQLLNLIAWSLYNWSAANKSADEKQITTSESHIFKWYKF